MKYAVLLVKDFALQSILRASPELSGVSVALVSGEGRKAVIAEISPGATGIEPGLAVSLAFARCPGLVIRPRDPNAESEASRLLLAAAFTLSPRVEKTDDGCWTVNLQGANAEHTERQMHSCVTDLSAANISVRMGAAETPLLAFYAAQQTNSISIISDIRSFLKPLALEMASPTPGQLEILKGWGIQTLGQLTALPKAEIGKRLGTDGARLWERAAGETTRVLALIEIERTFSAEWEYDPPIESMEPLLFRLQRFSECVAFELRGAALVAERLSLSLLLEDDSEHRRDFRLPEPSANVPAWMRVFHTHLEQVTTPSRLVGVRLVASPARAPTKQDGLFDTGLRDPALFWENLARVGAIVGDDRVGTPVLRDTWKPDSVALEKPAETVPLPDEEPIHPPRGLTLRRFRPAWPVRVEFGDQRPTAIETTSLQETVTEAIGPFRQNGLWWKAAERWDVEVWQVEVVSGVIYQIGRHANGWEIEGVLD